MRNFYNTTGLKGFDLFRSQEKAKKQDDIILQILREDGEEMTPFEVNAEAEKQGYHYPITSIRRSITNLTKEGKLEKLLIKRNGVYGQKNYTWRAR